MYMYISHNLLPFVDSNERQKELHVIISHTMLMRNSHILKYNVDQQVVQYLQIGCNLRK